MEMKIDGRIDKMDDAQRQEVARLLASCRRTEPVTLSFPSDEEDHIFLLYDGQALASAMSFTFPEPDICECVIFTHPSKRRRGCADRLLEELCLFLDRWEESYGPVELLFLTDHKSRDAMACLTAWEAMPERSEYMMERQPSAGPSPLPGDGPVHRLGDGSYQYRCQGTVLASCRIDRHSHCFYLHHMEVAAELRGQGHGTRFLSLLLPTLSLPVRLQVSSDNLPALLLYKKTGFQVMETLSSYRY